jgi:hypothetical protein
LNGFQSIAGFANNLDVPSQCQEGAQVLSHSFHIVHDQYTDVCHAPNIRAGREERIWRGMELAMLTKLDFFNQAGEVGLHLKS